MDWSPVVAKQFYDNFGDRNVNVDPAARRQRATYDANLRNVPKPAGQKYLETQNAVLRQKIEQLEKEKSNG